MEIAAESGREIEIEDAIKYPSVLLYGEIDAAEYLANRNLSDVPPKPKDFLGKGIRFTMGIDWEHIDRNKIYIIYYTDAEKFDGFALLPCRDWYVASNQHGGIGRFFVLLVRIALVTVTDLGRGGAAGGVDGAAFGTYRGSQGHCGGENLAVVLCGLVVSVRYMLLFVGTNSGGGSLW